MLQLHNSSLAHLLSVVYPDYNWLPWKFSATPKNYWSEPENQRKFIEWAGKQLKIKDMSDWYTKTYEVKVLKNW